MVWLLVMARDVAIGVCAVSVANFGFLEILWQILA